MQRISRFFAAGIVCLALFNFSFSPLPLQYQNPNSEIGVVSADKMNILYIGVDNPVSAAIAGVPIDQTQVSVTNGTITKTDRKGTYNVRVNSPGVTTIEVTGKDRNGRQLSGSGAFRVKRISDPIATIGGRSGGSFPIATFKAQKGMIAELNHFNFDANFQIVSFDVFYSKPRTPTISLHNQGATFHTKVRSMMEKAQIGDIFYFDNIRVKAPDETTRHLPTLSFKLR